MYDILHLKCMIFYVGNFHILNYLKSFKYVEMLVGVLG